MLIEVVNHVYDIPKRLREIDEALRVFFNTDTQEYEVRGNDLNGEYVLGSFPYLDCRVLSTVRKGYWLVNNKSRPWKEFLKQIRQHNERLDVVVQKELLDVEAGLQDDLKWIGRNLYQGWRC